jgi:hypothetical protein
MNNEQVLTSAVYPTKIFKNLPYLPKEMMLLQPFWHAAKTNFLAGLSHFTRPAELIETAQNIHQTYTKSCLLKRILYF